MIARFMPDLEALGAAKAALRPRLATIRAAHPTADRDRFAAALPRLVAARFPSPHAVAGYIGVADEPPTLPLIDDLRARGVTVLLPVVDVAGALDWAAYDGNLVDGRYGLREPPGERLGVDAIGGADLVLVPALAV